MLLSRALRSSEPAPEVRSAALRALAVLLARESAEVTARMVHTARALVTEARWLMGSKEDLARKELLLIMQALSAMLQDVGQPAHFHGDTRAAPWMLMGFDASMPVTSSSGCVRRRG